MTNLYVFRDGELVATIHGINADDCMEMAEEQNLTEEFGYGWSWIAPSQAGFERAVQGKIVAATEYGPETIHERVERIQK